MSLMYDAVNVVVKGLDKVRQSNSFVPPPSTSESCFTAEPWHSGAEYYTELTNVSFKGITGPINFTETGINTRISYEVVNFREQTFIKVGSWTNTGRLSLMSDIEFLGGDTDHPSTNINNLYGLHLRLGITEEPPFAWRSESINCNSPGCWYGYCPDLVARLASELNFTYEYIEPTDKKFGGLNSTTKQWNGMIGDLIAGKTDVITMVLSVSSERKMYIDFSFPFMNSALVAVVKGESAHRNTFFFLSPFQPNVWVSLLLVICVVSIFMNLFNKLSQFGRYGAKIHAMQTCSCGMCVQRRDKKKLNSCSFSGTNHFDCVVEKVDYKDELNALSIDNSSWVVTARFVGMSGGIHPKSSSGRLLLIVWCFFVKVILSMYTANLTALLTINQLGTNLKTIKDLLSQKQYDWGVIHDRHPESLMLNHLDKDYTKIVEEGISFDNLSQALDVARAGEFVLIDETPVIAYNMKEDCDVFAVGVEFQSFEYAFGLPKNSPYENLLNKYILKYREDGYCDALWQLWSVGDDVCSTSSISGSSMFDMSTLAGVFYLLALGIAACFLLIFLELVYVSWLDSKEKKQLRFWDALRQRLQYKIRDIVHEWVGVAERETKKEDMKDRHQREHVGEETDADEHVKKLKLGVPQVQSNPITESDTYCTTNC
uniref:Lig_chan domain-containing protein n=1 Tax=Bathyctena chuni TaxID=1403704 RepID=V9PNT6_BATCU|nr:Lig_chan domain-containing protein [Bathyctena chuni]